VSRDKRITVTPCTLGYRLGLPTVCAGLIVINADEASELTDALLAARAKADPVGARHAARTRRALDGADAQALEGALAATERERDEAMARVAELEVERDQARQAASAWAADLRALAVACEQRDDEYPRQAVERRLAELSLTVEFVRRWLAQHGDAIPEHEYQELASILGDAPPMPERTVAT